MGENAQTRIVSIRKSVGKDQLHGWAFLAKITIVKKITQITYWYNWKLCTFLQEQHG